MTGEQIRQLRDRAGMNLADLAKKSGVSKPRLSRLENGAIKLGHMYASSVLALARALGTTVEQLLRNEGDDMKEYKEFFDNLDALDKRDLQVLQMASGHLDVQSLSIPSAGAFYSVLPETVPPEQETVWLGVAAWYAEQKLRYAKRPTVPLPVAVGHITKDLGSRVMKRFYAVLDAGDVHDRLSRVNDLLTVIWNEGQDAVDMQSLLDDILVLEEMKEPTGKPDAWYGVRAEWAKACMRADSTRQE